MTSRVKLQITDHAVMRFRERSGAASDAQAIGKMLRLLANASETA